MLFFLFFFFFWFRILIIFAWFKGMYNVFVPLLPLAFSQDHSRHVTHGVPQRKSSFLKVQKPLARMIMLTSSLICVKQRGRTQLIGLDPNWANELWRRLSFSLMPWKLTSAQASCRQTDFGLDQQVHSQCWNVEKLNKYAMKCNNFEGQMHHIAPHFLGEPLQKN